MNRTVLSREEKRGYSKRDFLCPWSQGISNRVPHTVMRRRAQRICMLEYLGTLCMSLRHSVSRGNVTQVLGTRQNKNARQAARKRHLSTVRVGHRMRELSSPMNNLPASLCFYYSGSNYFSAQAIMFHDQYSRMEGAKPRSHYTKSFSRGRELT